MKALQLQMVFATSEAQREIIVEVPSGTTLQNALEMMTVQISVLLDGGEAEAIGVWSKVRPPHYVLRDGDRIEFYRPLKADPKQARRARVGQERRG